MEENKTTQSRKFLGLPLNKTNFIILIIAAVLAVAASIAAFFFVRDLIKGWTLTNIPGAPVATQSDNQPAAADDPFGEDPAGTTDESVDFTLSGAEPLPSVEPWDGASRVNILFVGLDYRDWEEGSDASRTDTMILFTIDPKTKTAGMLSIPRDLWVHIPGFTHGKINTAYYLGEVYDYPGGGPALAMETVEHFLGVPIDYYAQVDFITFIHLIDELGGVKLEITEPIKLYPLDYPDFGSFTSVTVEPGVYNFPGNYALAYARSRSTEGGDFDRAGRQQELIMAIRNQMLRPDIVSKVLNNGAAIYDRLSAGIHTNLSFQQAMQLGFLALELDLNNIKSGIISPEMLYTGKSPDGLDILIAIPDEIRQLRDEIFGNFSGATAMVDSSLSTYELAIEENPSIGIYNGTYEENLAGTTADYFIDLGFNVSDSGNAGDIYTNTTVYIYAGCPQTAAYLTELMNLHPSRVRVRYDPEATVDIAIMLGSDWVLSNPMP